MIDYSARDLTDRLLAAVPEGATQYWETSGKHDLHRAVAVTAPWGYVVISAGPEEQPGLPIGPFYMRNVHMVGFVITRATEAELVDLAAGLGRLLESGSLPVRVAQVLPLEKAAGAHRLAEGTKPKAGPGRIVIQVTQ